MATTVAAGCALLIRGHMDRGYRLGERRWSSEDYSATQLHSADWSPLGMTIPIQPEAGRLTEVRKPHDNESPTAASAIKMSRMLLRAVLARKANQSSA